jgi:hypothetical protein
MEVETHQKEKKSLISFSLVWELMFLTWTVLADMMRDCMVIVLLGFCNARICFVSVNGHKSWERRAFGFVVEWYGSARLRGVRKPQKWLKLHLASAIRHSKSGTAGEGQKPRSVLHVRKANRTAPFRQLSLLGEKFTYVRVQNL